MEISDELKAEMAEGLAFHLPHPPAAVWFEALRRLLASRAVANTAGMQLMAQPDLRLLAASARFIFSDRGPWIACDPPGQRALDMLRRGGLWYRGGDVEAEMLALFDELRT
jgi:hypothetical protein